MIKLHHLNCLKISSPITEKVIGHCLLIEEKERLLLIDAGIGLLDTQKPKERIGQELIDLVGFQFNEKWTALYQIKKLGLNPEKVSDCIITHLDPDHIGGLVDFPHARIHVSKEELENFNSGNPRYLKQQLSHNPILKIYSHSNETWFGFEARKLDINIEMELYLIPLFGHTIGHCGVALKYQSKWFFYVGDAYYMNVELTYPFHPVNELAKLRADNNNLRIETVNSIKTFIQEQPQIEVFCYHDSTEFY